MKNKISIMLMMALSTVRLANADELVKVESPIEISGYLDFYYQLSPQGHAPVPVTPAGPNVVEGRFFDRSVNQMTLNMAEVSIKKKVGKVSVKADVAFGEMVDQLSGGGSQSVTASNPANSAANEPTRNITQATISYSVTDRLALMAGKFYSFMGYEVTKAKDNWQYSRSYIFNYGIPFWHEGVSATYSIIPERLTGALYLLNAWDGRISQEQNHSSTTGANINFSGGAGFIVNYNFIGGNEASSNGIRQVHELNAIYNLSSKYAFALDYIYGSQSDVPEIGDAKWSGLAIYVKAQLTDWYILSPRYEIFDDSDQGFAVSGGLSGQGLKQKVTSLTLANNFILEDGLEGRIEFRSDKSDAAGFFKDSSGAGTDRQESYTAALLYSY